MLYILESGILNHKALLCMWVGIMMKHWLPLLKCCILINYKVKKNILMLEILNEFSDEFIHCTHVHVHSVVRKTHMIRV